MTLLIFPDRNTPHWAVAEEQPAGQRATPHPASTGYRTWADATAAALVWALSQPGRTRETLTVTGRADKAAAREFGVRVADARPGRRMGQGAHFRQQLALLYKNTRDGKVPTFEDFAARLAKLDPATEVPD